MKINNIQLFAGFLMILSLMAGQCKQEGTSTPDPLFLKCWVNAFEEEGPDQARIYRPCITHTLPAARYRNTFTLKENGIVEYSVLAPNDAHTTAEGTWSYDPGTKKLRILGKDKVLINEFVVLELNEDLLKLKE
jgi:hypothetical protein